MPVEFFKNEKMLYIVGILVFLSLFLLVLACIFFFQERKHKKSFSAKMKEYQEQQVNLVLEDIQNSKKIKSIYDKLDLLLARSQLKYKYSFNVFLFVAISILSGLYGYFATLDIIEGFISPLVLGIAFGVVPFVLIEFLSTMRAKKLKSQIISIIPVLINNSKLTGGDIFRTIKQSVPKVNAPISMYLQEFTNDYENGIAPNICFDNLREKIADYKFKRIVDSLENHLYKGGNVVITLSSLNKEYLSREVEEDRRKKQNSSTVLGIYVAVAINFFILWLINLIIPEVIIILKQNEFLIAIGLVNTLISLFVGYKATKMQTSEG